MTKLWICGYRLFLAAIWLLGSIPVYDDSRVYAADVSQTEATTVMNANTATAKELEALEGIGPAIAKRIVDYRAQYGSFEFVDELQNVPGIGPIKFEKIKRCLTI